MPKTLESVHFDCKVKAIHEREKLKPFGIFSKHRLAKKEGGTVRVTRELFPVGKRQPKQELLEYARTKYTLMSRAFQAGDAASEPEPRSSAAL